MNRRDGYRIDRVDVHDALEEALANALAHAIVMAGDLTEMGFNCEYKNFFDVLDNQTVTKNLLIATGNHDVRYAYKKNKPIIMNKVEEYLGIDTKGESFYSYDINGYTFIVMASEKQVFERAYISERQLAFLDGELQKATAEGKPAFVVCHQPLKKTHGLPEVWKTGDLGDQSQQVRDVLTKYKNVFYINGRLKSFPTVFTASIFRHTEKRMISASRTEASAMLLKFMTMKFSSQEETSKRVTTLT